MLLKTVEKAICRSFERISGARNTSLFFDLDTHRLVLEFETADGNAQKFAMDEMSDGYKNTLSMIGDIAYRMAVLNPTLGDQVLEKTPGVVLIDEIDLHLHPQWQQTILSDLHAIFPEVQFIVSLMHLQLSILFQESRSGFWIMEKSICLRHRPMAEMQIPYCGRL